MARAVIKFSKDISSTMPQMYRAIEGCAYNPGFHIAAFRFENMRIIVERKHIIIYGAKDKTTGKAVYDWLINIVNGVD